MPVSGVCIVSLPDVAIPSYVVIITIGDHLQNVIIKVLRFHFFPTFKILNYKILHHQLWVLF